VYVKTLKAMTGYIGNVTTNATALTGTLITGFKYNFTAPYSNDLYLVLQPETGSSKGDFDVLIQFSYYEYNPNCVQYTSWNGTACVNNYDEYC
jgi:hypothetical protein